ncbi:DUF2294 family protein [Cytobacillus suaedae]|nr:DUF2294 family protein [Cytobacillus suaedae]
MINTSEFREDLAYLSSSLSKRLKQKFGKGPETCFASLKDDMLSIHIKKFITPAEEVLIESENNSLTLKFRSVIMQAILNDFISEVMSEYQIEIETAFHDWNYENNSGMILFKINQPVNIEDEYPFFAGNRVIQTLQHVSSNIHKVPTNCKVIRLNANLYVIECQEIMLDIEKVLYKKGYEEILIERSKEIRNSYTQHIPLFEEALGRRIESLFIMWDYENDNGYVLFSLN